MNKTSHYHGYTIQSAPYRQTDSDKWQLHIFISVEDTRGVQTRAFPVDGLYATEEEADLHGITYGQRLIDGKVDGQSIDDMKDSGSGGPGPDRGERRPPAE